MTAKKKVVKKEKLVDITIELNDELLLALCLQAHKNDFTLNEWCNLILKAWILEEEKGKK